MKNVNALVDLFLFSDVAHIRAENLKLCSDSRIFLLLFQCSIFFFLINCCKTKQTKNPLPTAMLFSLPSSSSLLAPASSFLGHLSCGLPSPGQRRARLLNEAYGERVKEGFLSFLLGPSGCG